VLRSEVLRSAFDALVLDGIRIGHLLADQIDNVTMLFVITLDGLWLRKYSLLSNNQLCFLEQIELKPTDVLKEQWKVNRVEWIATTVGNESTRENLREIIIEISTFLFSEGIIDHN
jgi:hypothetical protein